MAAGQFGLDDPGDQESADDEEDVDAEKAARHDAELRVVEDDGDHRDRAQAVDLRPVSVDRPGRGQSRYLPRFSRCFSRSSTAFSPPSGSSPSRRATS